MLGMEVTGLPPIQRRHRIGLALEAGIDTELLYRQRAQAAEPGLELAVEVVVASPRRGRRRWSAWAASCSSISRGTGGTFRAFPAADLRENWTSKGYDSMILITGGTGTHRQSLSITIRGAVNPKGCHSG